MARNKGTGGGSAVEDSRVLKDMVTAFDSLWTGPVLSSPGRLG